MTDLKVPLLFLREQQQDGSFLAIPKINPAAAWLLTTKGKVTITMMLDGQCVMLKSTNGKREMFRRMRSLEENQVVNKWILCRRESEADKPLWEAYDDERPYADGIYEVIGPSIKGNPHRIAKHKMAKVIPAAYNLCPRPHEHGIRLFSDINPETLFGQIKRELADPACDIEGLCFQEESWSMGMCDVQRATKIRKKDFGLQWPPIVAEKTKEAEIPVGTYGQWPGMF